MNEATVYSNFRLHASRLAETGGTTRGSWASGLGGFVSWRHGMAGTGCARPR